MTHYITLKTSGDSELYFDKYDPRKRVTDMTDVLGLGQVTNLKVVLRSGTSFQAVEPGNIQHVLAGKLRYAFEVSGALIRPLDLWVESVVLNETKPPVSRYNPPEHMDKFTWSVITHLMIQAETERGLVVSQQSTVSQQGSPPGAASQNPVKAKIVFNPAPFPMPTSAPTTVPTVGSEQDSEQEQELARHTAVVGHAEPTVEQVEEALNALAQQAAQTATDLFKDQPAPILVGVQNLADGSLDEIWYYPRWVKKHGVNKKRWQTEIDVLRKRQDDTGRNPLIPRHIAMPGDAGNGKTFASMIAFGPNIRKVSCSEETLASDMAGYKAIESDGVGGIQERLIMGEVLKAYTHKHDDSCKRDEAGRCGGEVVILDEGDRPNPQVMTLMHPMMDGSPTFTYLGVEYTRGEATFLVVLTYNPHSEGSYIADPLWSRMGRPLRWEVSLWTAKRLGVRQELLDFTAKMLTMIRNGDSNVQAPSLRLLLRANAEWNDNGEESGWGELLSENRGSSRTVWLEVIKARVGTKMGRELENSEGAMLIADDDWSLIASDTHASDPTDDSQ